MKRALAIAAVLCLVGTLAFGQAITGRWRLHGFIDNPQTPSLNLRTDFLVNYTVSGWTFSGYGLATDTLGLYYVYLGASATVGPFSFTSYMNFIDGPALKKPAGWLYYYTTVSTGFEFGGLKLDLFVWHDTGLYGMIIGEDLGFGDIYPYWSIKPKGDQNMIYYLKAQIAPVRFDILFLDECQGIEFHQAMIMFQGMTLCCPYTLFFSFKKDTGFDYLRFSFSDLSICCGWSFGIDIEYGLTRKTVTLYPKYGPIDSCFKLFGGPMWDATNKDFLGWDFHGFACSLKTGDCHSIGFLTAFNPEFFYVRHRGVIRLFPAMASGYSYRYWSAAAPLPNWWTWYWRDLFLSCTVDDVKRFVENEVFWFTACGPGCCGGTWRLEVNVFTNFAGTAGLFGITRIQALASIPIMTNLTFDGFIRISKLDCKVTPLVCTPSAISVLGAGITFSF